MSFRFIDIGDDSARAIADSAHARSLRSLDVSHTEIGHEGLAALLRSRHLASLEQLSWRDIEPEPTAALAELALSLPASRPLRHLSIDPEVLPAALRKRFQSRFSPPPR